MLYGFSRDRAVPLWQVWVQVDSISGVPLNAGKPARPVQIALYHRCYIEH